MRVQGRPTKKLAIFGPQMDYKCQFSANTRVVCVRVVSSKPPNPNLQVVNAKGHVLQGMEAREWVFPGRPT